MSKDMWYDDVNTFSLEVVDHITDFLEVSLTDWEEEQLMEFIFKKLDPYSMGDYASYN